MTLALRLWLAGFVCFCAGGLYGWSALIAPLQAAYGINAAQTGLVFSLAIVCFTLSVLFSARIAPRAAPAARIAGFGMAATLCLLLAAMAPSYVLFIVLFSAGFGSISGAIYVSAVSMAASAARHGLATPMMVASFGLGGSVFGPLWRTMAAGWGLWALWPLALGCALASSLLWITEQRAKALRGAAMERSPSEALLSEGPPPDEPDAPMPLRTGVLIWLTFAFGSFGGLMVLGMAAKMLDAAGAALALSSGALAAIAIANTLGRLSVAGITLAAAPVAAVFSSVLIGGAGVGLSLSASAASSARLLAAGLVLVALGYGIMASAVPALVRAEVSAQRFGAAFAWIFTAWGVAGFCAPVAAGALYDRTQSFAAPLWLALCTTVLSGVAGVMLWQGAARARRAIAPQR